jgi:hypothetical protein
MKKLITLMAVVCVSANAMSQSDSTKAPAANGDTIRIGNMIIIRNGEKSTPEKNNDTYIKVERNRNKKLSNVSTNWAIFDIGFTNYTDKTNYGNTGTYLYNRPGVAPLGASDFNLNAGKSVNVNFWLFMQRLNLVKHHLNLKYGLGVELNNYRYSSNISYLKQNPYTNNQLAPAPVVIRDSVFFSKNKLAADYVTVPFMINYTSHPGNHNKGFSISLGVSAGYLYSQRNKQVSDTRGKQVNRGGFDLEQFKISYIGEIGLGPVRLYGSYVPQTIYKTGLDMRPYTLGVRFSNW